MHGQLWRQLKPVRAKRGRIYLPQVLFQRLVADLVTQGAFDSAAAGGCEHGDTALQRRQLESGDALHDLDDSGLLELDRDQNIFIC